MQLIRELMEMSQQEATVSKDLIRYLFRKLGIDMDVQWTHHFRDRLTDHASDRQDHVTQQEFIEAFKKLRDTYGDRIVNAQYDHKEFVGVLKDMSSQLNIPFAIGFNNGKHKYYLHGITIMRKNPHTFHLNQKGGQDLYV